MVVRVIVVEDDAELRRSLARRLQGEGMEVIQASSWAEVSAQANSPFDYGVFDIVLPDGNGIDAAAELLTGGSVGRAVFFTGSTDVSALERAASLGRVVQKGDDGAIDDIVRLVAERDSWPPFELGPEPAPESRRGIVVRFIPGTAGILSVLEVRSPRHRSVLPVIQGVLFELRVQIVRAESKVLSEGLVERLHIVEFDGAPIGPRRHLEVQMGVLGTLEAALDDP